MGVGRLDKVNPCDLAVTSNAQRVVVRGYTPHMTPAGATDNHFVNI
jgi:hypothetical protein